jgi:hypothetical protein
MSNNVTKEKLDAFAAAVTKAASEHLGANGVISIAIGLDYETYCNARMEKMRDSLDTGFIHPTSALTYFSDFIAIVEAGEWGEFAKILRQPRVKLTRFPT